MAFAQIYNCPKCGEVWRVTIVPEPCGECDFVEVAYCDRCYSPVREKFIDHDGKRVPMWHALTEEEIIEETTDYSNPDAY